MVHSRIADLRKRGYVINCEHGGTGASSYVYTLCAGDPSGSLPSPSGGPRSEVVAAADTPSSVSPAQMTLVDVWRDGLKPDATVVYLHDTDRDNYSRKVGAA